MSLGFVAGVPDIYGFTIFVSTVYPIGLLALSDPLGAGHQTVLLLPRPGGQARRRIVYHINLFRRLEVFIVWRRGRAAPVHEGGMKMETQNRNILIALIINDMDLTDAMTALEEENTDSYEYVLSRTLKSIDALIQLDEKDSKDQKIFDEYLNMLTEMKKEHRQDERARDEGGDFRKYVDMIIDKYKYISTLIV